MKRAIAPVVRRTTHAAQGRERLAFWAARSIEERLAEVEVLRRMWIEQTGDPDAPLVVVVHRRRLGARAIKR